MQTRMSDTSVVIVMVMMGIRLKSKCGKRLSMFTHPLEEYINHLLFQSKRYFLLRCTLNRPTEYFAERGREEMLHSSLLRLGNKYYW